MDPVRNPFVPGAGAQPHELTGRHDLLERARVTLERVSRGRPAKSFVAVGLRGVGKTVLLNRVKQIADERSYRTSFIEAHEQKSLPELLVPHLRRILLDLDRLGALSDHAKRALRVLKSFMTAVKLKYADAEISLDVDPEQGSADSGDLETDLPDLFLALGRAAAARTTSVAILVDEIQYLAPRDMGALIMAMHRIAQENLPIVLIAAGLPQVVGLSGRSKSYAERLFDFPPVDALGHDDAVRALDVPVREEGGTFDRDALDAIVQTTRGYPYFLQEWGYHTWNTATHLGPGPHRSGDIAEVLQIAVQAAAPLRGGLIGKGMIFSPAHGDTAFTVPLFDEFLRRIIPDWRTPYANPRTN